MTSNKKMEQQQQDANVNANTNTDTVTDCPELESIYNFDKEVACYKGQYIDEINKIEYGRWEPVEQTKWNNFRAKCIDVKSEKWFKSGDSTGIRSPTGQRPRRTVTLIIRLKTKGEEYLLSNSSLVGYNAFGDPVTTAILMPEKWTKTIFAYEQRPNFETGFSSRVNIGPQKTETVYTMEFNKANAEKLFGMRKQEDEEIQLVVKSETAGKIFEVKKQGATLEENFQMFVDSDFSYLFNAMYITPADKLLAMKQAEIDGIINKSSDDEKMASLNAQNNLSQADKMQSYG